MHAYCTSLSAVPFTRYFAQPLRLLRTSHKHLSWRNCTELYVHRTSLSTVPLTCYFAQQLLLLRLHACALTAEWADAWSEFSCMIRLLISALHMLSRLASRAKWNGGLFYPTAASKYSQIVSLRKLNGLYCIRHSAENRTLHWNIISSSSSPSSSSSSLSLDREGRWGTTDDFTTSFLHFRLFSTAL